MQRFIYFLFAGLFTANMSMAQFSAVGGLNGTPYSVDPATYTGLDKVFVFNGLSNAKLTYATGNPSDWTWYKYDVDPTVSVIVPSEVNATETILSNVESDCGYIVVSSGGAKHYVYIVEYKPIDYTGISFKTDIDACNSLTLIVQSEALDMDYYTTKGVKTKLGREHMLSWNTLEWNATDKSYATVSRTSKSGNLAFWSVDAPLCDTYFTVRGDQYADFFGNASSETSALYEAVAVKANASAEIQERDALNEIDRVSTSGDLSGSAPLNVNFTSNPSDAVEFKEWYIYDTPDATGTYKRRTDDDISYKFDVAGTFLVKLFVSNAVCKDSVSFNLQILDSFLDCPNFFTPRSTPGENDEFRVAYKSIVSFKGTIVNRWGNVLFEWTDPALGWNGTYKGKAVSPGVYFYLIEAKGSDGIVWKKKGDINLLE